MRFGAILNAGDTAPNAVLSQTVATTIGNTYQLQFEYNSFQGNPYAPPQSLDISAQSPSELLGTVETGPSTGVTGHVFTLDFTAGATSSIITFSDDSNNFTYSDDGALSNVSLTDLSPAGGSPTVPDHGSTWILLGLGLAALAGWARFGRRSLA